MNTGADTTAGSPLQNGRHGMEAPRQFAFEIGFSRVTVLRSVRNSRDEKFRRSAGICQPGSSHGQAGRPRPVPSAFSISSIMPGSAESGGERTELTLHGFRQPA